MKYRIKMDLPFDSESDAKKIFDYAGSLMPKASSINEGQDNEEVAYLELELCGHDEKKPCIKLEREELIDKKVVTFL